MPPSPVPRSNRSPQARDWKLILSDPRPVIYSTTGRIESRRTVVGTLIVGTDVKSLLLEFSNSVHGFKSGSPTSTPDSGLSRHHPAPPFADGIRTACTLQKKTCINRPRCHSTACVPSSSTLPHVEGTE